MRRLFLLFLLLACSASAEVVAGRNTLLVHDAWTPIGGGPLRKLGRPIASAAFDGDRFLVAWRDGDVIWLGLYDEGAAIAWTHTSFGVPGTSKPFIRWNGSFYVLVVEGNPTYVARVSRQCILESYVELPQAKSIVDVAASPFGVALLSKYDTPAYAAMLDVLLLDSAFRVSARTTIGSAVPRAGGGSNYLDTPHIAPFGNMFYAVWREGRSLEYDNIVGTRVLLDGSAPDVVPSPRERDSLSGRFLDDRLPSPPDIGLHPLGPRMAVVPLRQWGFGITATFVEPDGTPVQTNYRIGTGSINPPAQFASVVLPDGSIAVVYARNGVSVVRQLLKAPARRRSAAH